jgi:molecular chaperone GrpE
MSDEEQTQELPETAAPPPAESAQPAGGDAGREAAPDSAARLAELEQRVAELERQVSAERDAATDYMHRWQRAQADFSNFRRRAQQEEEQKRTLLAAQALAAVLPALDSFERAFTTLPATLRGFSWISGIELVYLQLQSALQLNGVQPVAAEPGQPFDPTRHQAIGEVESAEHPAGHIAVVIQRGYEAQGLLLRPTLVQLARAPEGAPAPSGEVAATIESEPAADDQASGVQREP